MRQLILKSVVLFSLIAILASITPVPILASTVFLPELTGELEFDPFVEPNFEAPGYRSIDFVLPDNITDIEQLTFVLSGQWSAGEIACDHGFENPDISSILPPISLLISSSAFPGDFFIASIDLPDGPFENLTAEFTSCCPGDVLEFNQLIGSDLHAELVMDFAILGICWLTADTYGTLDEVALQITGPVATEFSSWSRVKSLYR